MSPVKPRIYAFIDSQNLNLGTSKSLYKNGRIIYRGWKLDFCKFRKYLENKFHTEEAFLFIGYLKRNVNLYRKLNSFGYNIVFKPTVNDNTGKVKGNIDAELVLHASAIEFPYYNKAIIVSGDGDFYCLYEYLEKKNKLYKILIPNLKSESSLLKPFQRYKTFIIYDKEKLEMK